MILGACIGRSLPREKAEACPEAMSADLDRE
jgi:hypothetical protein